MSSAENSPSSSSKTLKSIITEAFTILNKGQAAKIKELERRILAIENTPKQPPHFASPPDGKPNNTTAPKAGREYPEFRCPNCPQGVKEYKYGKSWRHHFINNHLEYYKVVGGSGYCCWDCVPSPLFPTIKMLAEHRWEVHVKTGKD